MFSIVIGILLIAGMPVSGQKHLTIEDCVTGAASYLKPSDLEQMAWQPSGRNYTYVENDSLLLSPVNGRPKSVITALAELNGLLSEKRLESFSAFPSYYWINSNELLFTDDVNVVWYNVAGQSIFNNIMLEDEVENVDFSPDYAYVAFTIENNLYLYDSNGNRYEVSMSKNKAIVSGQTVHRNEFGISKGTFWNPEGDALAFYVKDETEVSDYPLVDVTQRVAVLEHIKYPMAGMGSEKVRVGIYHLENHSSVFLDTGEPDDHYLTNIAWSPDGNYLYLAEINREQNHVKLNQYNAENGSFVATLFEERDPKYVNPLNPIVFLPDDPDQFIWLSRRDGYNHIYLYASDGTGLKQITAGEWEVLRLEGFSPSGKAVYFTATRDGAGNEMLYKVNIEDGRIITVTPDKGVHNVILNSSEDLVIDRFSSTIVPNTINVRNGNGELIYEVMKAGNPLADYLLSHVEEGSLLAADGKTGLQYRLFTPRNIEAGRKYPVIVYVYNGPFVQLIKNAWVNRTELWLHYMADKGYVGFIVDGRGSANRGKEFEQVIYRSLGTNEMKDQLQGVEFLKSLDYTDPERLGVYGWSYGGFMTSSLMTTYPDVFKTGVAGGPVTDWKYYEVMYGERYMDTPDTNPEGYAGTSVLNKVQNLKGDLLVIHGAVDPVVVWQHSLMLLRKCVEEDVLVDYFVYPAHEHNVTGNDRVHLIRKITDYFERNL